ncbi:hypothetical protein AMECASPLE_006314 [Ameca splendens]|uniref:Uncharacterized protein n=1 Tax=Ameca splendens TaxID=208324 RepID=A0ABV0ZJN0_9TELE
MRRRAMDGWSRGRVGDAEGKRWCIHSSSGIYSRPEERRGESGLGAWLGLGFLAAAYDMGRGWEERRCSGSLRDTQETRDEKRRAEKQIERGRGGPQSKHIHLWIRDP